jgi:SAM-dependent methyltransferase
MQDGDPRADHERPAATSTFYAGGLSVATYDLFVQSESSLLRGDINFYLGCAVRYGGPVLELGAGTGRVLWPLAAAGHRVVGLDLSPAMLEIARGKAAAQASEVRARVALQQGNMIDFDLASRFALVLVPARAFQHLTTPEEQRAALGRIRDHLPPDGHLVLDLFDPLPEYCVPGGAMPPERVVRDPASGHLVRRRTTARQVDPLRQLITETLRFEVVDRHGTPIAAEETSWTLRWTYRQEMAWLLELTSFEVVEQYADFEGAPPAYGREQLWVARRG